MMRKIAPGTPPTRRGADARKEGELPKDKKIAEAGDNRRLGDQDGNRAAAKPRTRSR